MLKITCMLTPYSSAIFLQRTVPFRVRMSRTSSAVKTQRWAEDMQARFPAGTFDRIQAVLGDGEDRTDFVWEAVERELKRRERRS